MFHVWICPPHLPAFSACLTFDLMKHDLQSRGMEKGRGGMEGVRGKRRRGGRERKWWKGRRGGKRELLLAVHRHTTRQTFAGAPACKHRDASILTEHRLQSSGLSASLSRVTLFNALISC